MLSNKYTFLLFFDWVLDQIRVQTRSRASNSTSSTRSQSVSLFDS